MDFQNTQNNLEYNHPKRPPSTVMKLDRLGSFHQTRLSFTRRLLDDLKYQKSKIEIHQWNIDNNGIGSAIIKIIFKNEIGRVRDIEINTEGDVFLIADESDSSLYILKP